MRRVVPQKTAQNVHFIATMFIVRHHRHMAWRVMATAIQSCG
jgi:hypothetical protein